MVKKRVKVNSTGPMVVNTKESSLTTTSTVKESMNGLTIEYSLGTGNTIRCTDMVSSHGLTREFTKESIMTIKSKDKVNSHGQMEESTLEDGTMGNKMGLENTTLPRGKPNTESGKMERD